MSDKDHKTDCFLSINDIHNFEAIMIDTFFAWIEGDGAVDLV